MHGLQKKQFHQLIVALLLLKYHLVAGTQVDEQLLVEGLAKSL
jgi:hypothetical protein